MQDYVTQGMKGEPTQTIIQTVNRHREGRGHTLNMHSLLLVVVEAIGMREEAAASGCGLFSKLFLRQNESKTRALPGDVLSLSFLFSLSLPLLKNSLTLYLTVCECMCMCICVYVWLHVLLVWSMLLVHKTRRRVPCLFSCLFFSLLRLFFSSLLVPLLLPSSSLFFSPSLLLIFLLSSSLFSLLLFPASSNPQSHLTVVNTGRTYFSQSIWS